MELSRDQRLLQFQAQSMSEKKDQYMEYMGGSLLDAVSADPEVYRLSVSLKKAKSARTSALLIALFNEMDRAIHPDDYPEPETQPVSE